MVSKEQMIVLTVLMVCLHVTQLQAVQFSFNRAEVAISEGGDLPSQISILKFGENTETISFHVRVISGTATENEDYRSNNDNPYVFTNDTSQLPIRTQMLEDRAGESIESFMICLPEAQVLRSLGAEAVQPTCVTITIVDDDSVVIGFKNSREVVVEGGTMSVCAEVKPEGLRLDPFDRVPLSIRTNPASTEIQLNTNSLLFERAIGEQCVIVAVTDSDSSNTGNRSHTLILERSNEMSTVPVEVYPNTTSILVIDDDTPETDTSFMIVSPQTESAITVLEGSRIDGIQVLRLRDTILTYNVTLILTGPSGSNELGVMITRSLIFDPSTSERNVEVEILEDTMPEKRREFSISIDDIMVVGAPTANLATVVGGPVTIVVYDNDFEIEITNDELSVPEGSSNIDVCVEITKPEANSDIWPTLSLPIKIILENSPSSNIVLDTRIILLSATNKMVCESLSLNTDSSGIRSYSIQLALIDGQVSYDVHFPSAGQNITISNSQKGGQRSLGSGSIAGIVIIVLFTIGVCAAILIIGVIYMMRNKQGQKKKDDEDMNKDIKNQCTELSTPFNPPGIADKETKAVELEESKEKEEEEANSAAAFVKTSAVPESTSDHDITTSSEGDTDKTGTSTTGFV